jgi:hypothetical protein
LKQVEVARVADLGQRRQGDPVAAVSGEASHVERARVDVADRGPAARGPARRGDR